MKIVLNGRLGGTTEIDDLFHPTIIAFRKSLNDEFEPIVPGNDISTIQYFIFVNGEVAHYYDEMGVLNPIYLKQKKEVRLDLSLANLSEKIKAREAQDILRNLLKQSVKTIEDLSKKKKLDFDARLFENAMEAAIDKQL
ncbi:MAG TPA: Imm12 family immunity protein [Chitinophaga sp.]|uniref:Imm12 family immunity protein n=1 Tax=Chitinophaga sp. TaxID=1869181 RepID=UPI002C246E9A|nr:Imm12 family immunity protein [Chitinophaga sp.]HVI47542.1 Imm12 family immunity protein [Chitinophaga sp.]